MIEEINTEQGDYMPLDVSSDPKEEAKSRSYNKKDRKQATSLEAALPKRTSYHYASVSTAIANGLGAQLIRIEVSLHQGLPYFDLVGISGNQAQALRSRVTAAIKNSGFKFPDQKIIASITGDFTPGQANGLDLALAMALLQASGQVAIPDQIAFTGQLSLLGEFVHLPTVYNLFNCLASSGVKRIVSGRCNGQEAKEVKADFVLVSNLRECCALLNQARSWQDLVLTDLSPFQYAPEPIAEQLQLAELPAQYLARYALMIAASGKHHLLMLGGAGCGKTSLARLLPELLPPLREEERRAVLSIYSANGLSPDTRILSNRAPFRQPHFEISQAALIGGGSQLQAGEISLSHHGVLFLDELSEFQRVHLNALRTVLTDGQIDLARNRRKQTLPADIILVAATNPCPCGNYLESDAVCRCRNFQIRQKLDKLRGPFMDRIDLFVELKRIPKNELLKTIEDGQLCDIDRMRQKVAVAVEMQEERYRHLDRKTCRNSNLASSLFTSLFEIEAEALRMAEHLAETYRLSVRSFHKLLRVARSIADLDESYRVSSHHIYVAAQFRAKPYFWSEEDLAND